MRLSEAMIIDELYCTIDGINIDAKDDVNQIGIENNTMTESTQHDSFGRLIKVHSNQYIIKLENLNFNSIFPRLRTFKNAFLKLTAKMKLYFVQNMLEVAFDIYVT